MNHKDQCYKVTGARNINSISSGIFANFKTITTLIFNDVKLCDHNLILKSVVLPHHDSARWKKIGESLKDFAKKPSIYKFEKTVMAYHDGRKYFSTLDKFDRPHLKGDTNKTLGSIATNALELPALFPSQDPIRMLTKGIDSRVTLTEKQICCLLSNAFFCTFREMKKSNYNEREVKRLKKDSNMTDSKDFSLTNDSHKLEMREPKENEIVNMPNINFFGLFGKMNFSHDDDYSEIEVKFQKLQCILQYFKTVLNRRPIHSSEKRQVTYHRQVIKSPPDWSNSKNKLSDVNVVKGGFIEDAAYLLQVDFANKLVGGGVIGRGCVQEEIRFVICPELIVSRLFTEELGDMECLIVTGIERFSNYTGYSRNFKFGGEHQDSTPLDDYHRRLTQVLVMDALKFSYEMEQFDEHLVLREMNKAYCGFKCDDEKSGFAIATGNWGCGAFKGNKELKFLIQLMASSQASRGLCYFTFDDEGIANQIEEIHNKLSQKDINTGDLYHIIMEAINRIQIEKKGSIKFFDCLDMRKRLTRHEKVDSPDTREEEETQNSRSESHVSSKNIFLSGEWHP